MLVLLKRVEPEAHMNRWYMVQIQATLLDPIAVICSWGSRDTAYEQSRIFPMTSQAAAEETAEKIVADKIKRGYERMIIPP